jgi:restriction system protein
MEEVGYGILRALDPLDIGEPVEAIRAYLTVKYEDCNKVHPRKFEEVVCTIFRDLGYRARITSYSADGGIDVYLDGPDNALVGVQVKRYEKPIEIQQINALTGAMVIKGCAKGIFVTTSRYRKGAAQTAKKSQDNAVTR